jgi:hypothetical protein
LGDDIDPALMIDKAWTSFGCNHLSGDSMKDRFSGDSTIFKCQKHLQLFWLGGLHLLTSLQFLVSHIQFLSSSCEHEILSIIVVQEEDLQDRVDVNIDDCVTEDSRDCSSYVITTLNKNEKDYRVGEEEDEFSAESLFKECCDEFENHV